MNIFSFAKKITTIIFIICIFAFTIVNLFFTFPKVKDALYPLVVNYELEPNKYIKAIQKTVNDNVFAKQLFIENFGLFQKILQKDEVSNFYAIKDEQGKFHLTKFINNVSTMEKQSNGTIQLKQALDKVGTKLIYVMAPNKHIEGYTTFEKGLPQITCNQDADIFLDTIKNYGVDYIDLRKNIKNSNLEYDKLFYNIDHHWTTNTGFWAFGEIVQHIKNKYNHNLDPQFFYTNIDNYNITTYKNSFSGVVGRKTGVLYTGYEDFNLIYPKFPTNYNYTVSSENIIIENQPFENSLININKLNEKANLLSPPPDRYDCLLWGNKSFAQIENLNLPDGPKVLIIKDSFALPTTAYLSTVCSKIDVIDPRMFHENIVEFSVTNQYDYVIILFTAGNLTEEIFGFE